MKNSLILISVLVFVFGCEDPNIRQQMANKNRQSSAEKPGSEKNAAFSAEPENAESDSAEAGKKRNNNYPDITLKILENGEPNYVFVSHVLITFKDSFYDSKSSRTKDEAFQLAKDILDKAKSGEDFDRLIDEYSEYPGTSKHRMANFDQRTYRSRHMPELNIVKRENYAPGYTEKAFSMNVGEIEMVNYDPEKCKYGWFIMKRTR
ncbi:MAG: peptidylprolyl isomerase [Planctomycetota bacterium]